jgi:hypothetical protein
MAGATVGKLGANQHLAQTTMCPCQKGSKGQKTITKIISTRIKTVLSWMDTLRLTADMQSSTQHLSSTTRSLAYQPRMDEQQASADSRANYMRLPTAQ